MRKTWFVATFTDGRSQEFLAAGLRGAKQRTRHMVTPASRIVCLRDLTTERVWKLAAGGYWEESTSALPPEPTP